MDLWSTDCLRQRVRAVAFAESPQGEALWRSSGMAWQTGFSEAILFARAGTTLLQSSRIVMEDIATRDWRHGVERFCAWAERMTLGDATILKAERAAAIDGAFRWLLLLFAPRQARGAFGDMDELSEQLGQFKRSLQAMDSRFAELLPVIVPWGKDSGEDLESLRTAFHVFPDVCGTLALFDSTSRARFQGPGWCGDFVELQGYVENVLNGRGIRVRSGAIHTAGAPQGAQELTGDLNITRPLLLFMYAPWCAHSLNFVPLWHELVAQLEGASLELGQLDGSQHEPPDIALRAFPSLLLLLPKPLRVIRYAGAASVPGIQAWLTEHVQM